MKREEKFWQMIIQINGRIPNKYLLNAELPNREDFAFVTVLSIARTLQITINNYQKLKIDNRTKPF